MSNSNLSRFNSPILKTRDSERASKEAKSIEHISKMAQKFKDLKAQTNRPLYVDGTPIQNERFSKRMFYK